MTDGAQSEKAVGRVKGRAQDMLPCPHAASVTALCY